MGCHVPSGVARFGERALGIAHWGLRIVGIRHTTHITKRSKFYKKIPP